MTWRLAGFVVLRSPQSLKRIALIRFRDQRPSDYWADRGYDWYAGL